MMLLTETPALVDDDVPSLPTPAVRKTRCNVAGTGMLWHRTAGQPAANPAHVSRKSRPPLTGA